MAEAFNPIEIAPPEGEQLGLGAADPFDLAYQSLTTAPPAPPSGPATVSAAPLQAAPAAPPEGDVFDQAFENLQAPPRERPTEEPVHLGTFTRDWKIAPTSWLGQMLGGPEAFRQSQEDLDNNRVPESVPARPSWSVPLAKAIDATANRLSGGRSGPSTVTDLLESSTREANESDYLIPEIPPQQGTAAQVGAGLGNIPIGFANFMVSPEGAAITGGLGALPKSLQLLAELVWAEESARSGITAPTLQEKVEGLGGAALLGAGIAHELMHPEQPAPSKGAPMGLADITVPPAPPDVFDQAFENLKTQGGEEQYAPKERQITEGGQPEYPGIPQGPDISTYQGQGGQGAGGPPGGGGGPEPAAQIAVALGAAPPEAATAAAPAPAPAPPAEPPGSAWKGVPFLDQERIKTQLAGLGYQPDQIDGMTRSELTAALTSAPPAAAAPEPAPPAAAPEPAAPAEVIPSRPPRRARPLTKRELAEREHQAEVLRAAQEAIRAQGGMDLLEAVRLEGGLPGMGHRWAQPYRGEFKMLRETIRGTKGVRYRDVFSSNPAVNVDQLLLRLRARGFDIETPHELIDAIQNRIRTGKPDWGLPEMGETLAGLRVAEGAPKLRPGEKGTADLFQGEDQPFNLMGETGIDWEARQRAQEAQAQADAAAEAAAKEAQLRLFETPTPAEIATHVDNAGVPPESKADATQAISHTLGLAEDPALGKLYQPELFGAEPAGEPGAVAGRRPGRLQGGPEASKAGFYNVQLGRGKLAGEALAANENRISIVLPELVKGTLPGFDLTGKVIAAPVDFAQAVQSIRSPYQESLKVVLTEPKTGRVLASEITHLGTLNESIAHPRDIMRQFALLKQKYPGAELWISHNHPSGDPSPSSTDLNLHDALNMAAQTIGTRIRDHVITDGKRYYSINEGKFGDLPVPKKQPWEVIPQVEMPKIQMPSDWAVMAAGLRNDAPNATHIFYVGTRMNLTGVERVVNGNNPRSIRRAMAAGIPREGAYGVLLDLPEGAGRADLDNLEKAALAMHTKLLDVSWPGMDSAQAKDMLIRQPGYATVTGEGVAEEPSDPWPADFPRVTIHTNIESLKAHPDYTAAKAGDPRAALRVIGDLTKPDRLDALARAHPGAIVVPIHAEEETGRNKLPWALAHQLEDRGLPVEDRIVQSNIVHHTGADAITRMLRVPKFDGPVEAGRDYILADDVTTSGSTLAALRHYIESKGGHVVDTTSMATSSTGATGYGGELAIKPETAQSLKAKFGEEQLNATLRDNGIAQSIEHLTNSQGRYLNSFSGLDAIRDRIAASRSAAALPVVKEPAAGYGEARPFRSVDPESGKPYSLDDETRARFDPSLQTHYKVAALERDISRDPRFIRRYPGETAALEHMVFDVPETAPGAVRNAETLARTYGLEPVWFRSDKAIPHFGSRDPGKIYLNVDSTGNPVHLIAAHELVHELAASDPSLYRQLTGALYDAGYKMPVVGRYGEQAVSAGYPAGEVPQELAADFVMESLSNPARFQEVLGNKPALAQRIIGAVRDFIDRTIGQLARKLRGDPSASDTIKDLQSARTAVVETLRQFRGGETGPGERQFMRGPPTQDELEAAAASGDRQQMRGHIETVKRMTEVSPDVKQRVESWYTPVELEALHRQANARIDNLGLDAAQTEFRRSGADAQTMALGHNLALRLDSLGRYDEAAQVRDDMAAKLTTPAQTLWFISTIGKTSPEGLVRTAQKLVTELVQKDPEKVKLLAEIERLRTQLAALPQGEIRNQATEIVLKQMAAVKKTGERLSASALGDLIEKQKAGQLTPEALRQTLVRHFRIPELTADQISKIKAAQKAWADTQDPLLKLQRAGDMMDTVYGMVPRSMWDKIRATAVISMILHGRLPIRIGISNAARMFGQMTTDAILNVPRDIGNVFSGRSTITGEQLRAIGQGLLAPARAFGAGYSDAKLRGLTEVPSFRAGVRTMIDLANLTTRGLYEASDITKATHTFSSRFGRLFEDAVTLVHNVVPYAFWGAGFQSSLVRQMHIADVAVPTAEMISTAQLDANKAIFYNDTALSQSLMAARKVLDLPTAKITQGKYGIGTALIPFAKVPAAIVTEGATWTPLGFGKAGMEALRPFVVGGAEFRAKEFGDAMVKAALGTGSALLAGYQLQKLGVLTGAPDENKDLEAMRKASGWGAFRINLSELKRRALSGNWWSKSATPADGDMIINYNWLEPVAFPIAMGADLAHSQDKRMIDIKRGKITSGEMLSALGAGVQSVTETPMLQNIQSLLASVGESQWGKAFADLFGNVPGNFVPSLVRQTSQYMDNQVRETRGGTVAEQEANRILAQIPGLSQKYPPRYDVFGEAMQRYNYGNNSLINVFFNPAMVSRFKASPELTEMQRLYESAGKSPMERQVPATLNINGKQVQLTNDQVSAYQRYVGQASSATIARLMASPQYAREPIGMKQAVISQVLTAVNTAAKVDLFGQAPISVGMGARGPTLQHVNLMDVAAMIEARRRGLKTVPGQPAKPLNQPVWQLQPPRALPSLTP